MNRKLANQLNRRLLRNLNDRRTDHSESECHVASSVFFEADIFSRELELLFRRTPQPVAFSGELPAAGCFLALSVLDTPVLLTRDRQGRLRAFINACAHRGARIAQGRGQANKLVCGFHGWAYGAEGLLLGRPEDRHFSTAPLDCSLKPLPVSENHGVIVVAVDPGVSQQAVDEALVEIGEELSEYDFAHFRLLERRELTVNANWKLVNDLSLESYHFNVLHRDSVAGILAPNAVVDTFGRHSRWAFPLKSIIRLAGLDEADWPDSVEGSVTYTLYPGVMLLVNELGAQMIRAEPGSHAGEAKVSFTGMHAPGCDAEAAREACTFGCDVFVKEDLPVAEQCQRGIEARKGDVLLGANEPLLQFWHRLWSEAVSFD